MLKHIILWQLKDDLSAEEKLKIKREIKKSLESLKGKINEIIDIKVNIDALASSNADLMLDSSFSGEAELKAYAIHPEHTKIADNLLRPNAKLRVCMDFIV